MTHSLSITNKFIYLDFKVLEFLQPDSLQNVIFCGVFGSLVIHETDLQFTISNVGYALDTYKNMLSALKANLNNNYRSKDENSYFNKTFNFKLLVQNEYCVVIISKRPHISLCKR